MDQNTDSKKVRRLRGQERRAMRKLIKVYGYKPSEFTKATRDDVGDDDAWRAGVSHCYQGLDYWGEDTDLHLPTEILAMLEIDWGAMARESLAIP